MLDNRTIAESDPELAAAMTDELARQRDRLELIASENLVSRAVLEAAGRSCPCLNSTNAP